MRPNRLGKVTAAVAAILLAGCSSPQRPPAEKAQTEPRPAAPKITVFYPAVPQAAPGEAVTICYGVENAADVRLDPPVESLSPSFNRCFQVTARKTTTYTLFAKGKDGREISQAFTLPVRATSAGEGAARHLVAFFGASSQRIRRGEKTSLCYSVLGGAKFHITPPVAGADTPTRCVDVQPSRTTTYTIEATGPNGASDAMAVKVEVR